jgi:hypothetical protein
LCADTYDRGAYEFMRGKLQAAHTALEKLDRMSHVHFVNPEVLASLRLEIDWMTPPRHLREEPEELKHGYP